jgi:hypothetical protein
MTRRTDTPPTDLRPVHVSAMDADAADARANATRLAEAARLAALPGVVRECTGGVLTSFADADLKLGDHTPHTCIERRCPDTGALLVETLAFMQLGPRRGHVAHVVLDHPTLRPYRIETPLDLSHNGSTRPLCSHVEGFLARWPEHSHALERLVPAALGMEALALRLEAGRRMGNHPVDDAAATLANAVGRLRSHARADAGVASPWLSLHVECPTPWTRADAWPTSSSTRGSADRSLLTAEGREHLQTLLPSACTISWRHVVPVGSGQVTSRLSIEPLSIFVIPNPRGGAMERMRDSARVAMPSSHFALDR